jgi:hypothetical protein
MANKDGKSLWSIWNTSLSRYQVSSLEYHYKKYYEKCSSEFSLKSETDQTNLLFQNLAYVISRQCFVIRQTDTATEGSSVSWTIAHPYTDGSFVKSNITKIISI